MQTLSDIDLKRLTPSVFALEPWFEQSLNYRFLPTIEVINALRENNYHPVRAMQSRTRIPGKREFTKHLLRFRPYGDYQVSDIIPEIVLINSHDGTSSYQMMLGLFRLVCSNGAVVSDGNIETIRVTHRGDRNLCQDVIDASAKLINESPKVIAQVNNWRAIQLEPIDQRILAESVKEIYQTTLAIDSNRLLSARRTTDMPQGDGTRSLWNTYNVIQENVMRGGVRGVSNTGRRMRTRSIASVDRDVKLNKALWSLTAKMAELKTNQN